MITVRNITVAFVQTLWVSGHRIFRNSPRLWRRNSAMVGRGATHTGSCDGEPPGRSIQPVVGGAGGLGGEGGVRAPAGSGSTTQLSRWANPLAPTIDAPSHAAVGYRVLQGQAVDRVPTRPVATTNATSVRPKRVARFFREGRLLTRPEGPAAAH